ncbi:MAG: 50S ribosomal protein L29 [Candidatus Altiarchaeum hamiconexum]|uniref:Large ribosomal subunit protein uL29 n=1 Tax=Candidatus Altarchaeum hamiconexum TaxID=1803513 RepID=A0A8J7YTE7_9ARCH|nr:50S ribosomal protein L29 [Candidatus Altarchaeum hamiconexum]OIQ04642.1 MAG: 50S ribosomal protein L29 [Candidatus Altarchaeum sp. CG2_30_32_3053]PIN67178.1 MAG: 50S ribosomal protein L29 [Candidatus Altarchaeum sp. CG12_big_fil_rev_8_21_14_0_65_33_22]PIV28229.1 MAG: 50S ribosomal protein L29 [Candidatus Altarchaeum sp. CG03_land_8_20_14_0_80_32_618]PJC15167.1 MAG: 50S ribosomal protein L29 [Candidatus Altarchaeum sp. CG_4_9_14_0_8_um_filter_32_206]
MAILRAKELREMSTEDTEEHLKDLYKRKMKIKSDISAGISSESIGNLREIKRTIARLLTIKHEKETNKQ